MAHQQDADGVAGDRVQARTVRSADPDTMMLCVPTRPIATALLMRAPHQDVGRIVETLARLFRR